MRTALATLTERTRGEKRILAHEEARLVLLVDQLEELFTRPGISAEDRMLFSRVLAGLARSGVVWVVTTLRSDFWRALAENRELLALVESGSRLDLLPPDGAELQEIIRQPALAAGLSFETDPETGIGSRPSSRSSPLSSVRRRSRGEDDEFAWRLSRPSSLDFVSMSRRCALTY
jgi:hypothetical protein